MGSIGVGEVKGVNVVLSISIDFAQAVTGGVHKFKYERLLTCDTCHGQRVKQKSDEVLCTRCKGAGFENGRPDLMCPTCLGTGLLSVECGTCKGDGIMMKEVWLSVKIPKGVDNEMLLRVRDRGHQALNGKSGDLILRVVLKPHPLFTRDGANILSDQNISVSQAIMGGNCTVDTIHGAKQLKIMPGTAHNQQYRIRGAGFDKLGQS